MILTLHQQQNSPFFIASFFPDEEKTVEGGSYGMYDTFNCLRLMLSSNRNEEWATIEHYRFVRAAQNAIDFRVKAGQTFVFDGNQWVYRNSTCKTI